MTVILLCCLIAIKVLVSTIMDRSSGQGHSEGKSINTDMGECGRRQQRVLLQQKHSIAMYVYYT